MNEEEEWDYNVSLDGVMKVWELRNLLSKFSDDSPVMITVTSRARAGEFVPIRSVKEEDLWNQNTDGDPMYYGKCALVLVSDMEDGK